MLRQPITILGLMFAAGLIGGCQMTPASNFNPDNQAGIRAATHEFASAIRTGDADRVREVTASDDSQVLSAEVIRDTVGGRKVLTELERQFHYVEAKHTVIASDPWLMRLESAASIAPIQRIGMNRARLRIDGGGDVYVRLVDGEWKVELIPTMVDECNGQLTVNDPVVEYRFGVTRAMKEWMLVRLQRNDFKSKDEFDDARNGLWMEYLVYAANGKDPKDMLLPSLPPMPLEEAAIADGK